MKRLTRFSILIALAAHEGRQSAGKQDAAAADTTPHDTGVAMRTAPDPGTRYLTAAGLPSGAAVTLPDWVVNPTLDGVLGADALGKQPVLQRRGPAVVFALAPIPVHV